MKEIKNAESSVDTVLELEIGVDTVYVRSNIRDIVREGMLLKAYDEIQMTKDEYIETLKARTLQSEQVLADVSLSTQQLLELLIDMEVI